MRNDRGGVIVGYFAKIAIVLVAFSVVCFDAVAVAVAKVAIEDTAKEAAREASGAWQRTKNPTAAYKVALDTAEEHGATVDRKSFKVAADGTVTLTVEKEATTLLVYRTKKTASWAQVTATATGRDVQ